MAKFLKAASLMLAYIASTAFAAVPYSNPAGSEFPIVAWYAMPDSASTPERYLEAREAGFNLALPHHHTPEQVLRSLEAAKGTGVKVIAMCDSTRSNPAATVAMLKDHPSLAMWYLTDEPTTKSLPNLKALADTISALDNSHMLYLNLLPDILDPVKALGSPSYDHYLNGFVSGASLPFLSYDMYPVIEYPDSTVSLDPRFYQNFESARRVSARNGVPFWAFCLATPHAHYPHPRAEHISVEAYSALAYGAQGIQHFTYWEPETTVCDFHNSPIDSTGHRTDMYYLLADLNRQIRTLTPIFLGCEVTSVTHTGDSIPQGTTRATSVPAPFSALPVADGEGLLISDFKGGDGLHYLMLVNRSIHNAQTVTFPFSGPSPDLILTDGTIRQALPVEVVPPGAPLIYRIP